MLRSLRLVFILITFLISFSSFFSHADIVTGLVGWWRLDEGSGITAMDSSGHGNSGTLINMASPATSTSGWNPGKLNGALAFDGINDYVQNVYSSSLRMDSFTVSAWFKTNISSDSKIISLGVSCHPLQVFFDHLRICFGSCDAGTTFISGDVWHFAVVVGDGVSIRAFLDGGAVPEITKVMSTATYAGIIRIGAVGADAGAGVPALYFQGFIDDVRVYNRALTTSDVLDLYNNGGPTHLKNATIRNAVIK